MRVSAQSNSMDSRDRAAARRLLGRLPAEGRVVSLQGELFPPAGPIVRPAQGEAASAEQRFRQTEAALARVEQELRAAEAERGQALSSLEREQAEGGGPASHLDRQISLAQESEADAR